MTDQQPPQPDPNQPQVPPAGQQPYPPQYAPYPGQPYPPQYAPNLAAPSKALAITALVLAILGFFVVTAIAAVVLAIIVLVQSRDGRPHGKGMAISALVICVLWFVGFIVVVVAVVTNKADRDSSGTIVDDGFILVTSIRVGDCLVDEPGESVQITVEATPCSRPHREEAYATFDLGGGEFPGQAEVDRLAEEGCASRFEEYVGISYDESELDVVFLRPFEDSWDADTGVTCMVSDGGLSVGSLKGANN